MMDSDNKSVGERLVERLTEFSSLAEAVATIEALRRRVAEYENDLNAGRELMRTAWSEMNAIRARDGAPSGVSHEWWSAITDQLQHLLKDDAKPWMLGAARVMFEQHETHRIRAAEGERDSYEQIADEYSRKACDLTAENAELKRQVEALREDAEVGRDAIEAMAIMDTLRRIDEGWSVEILNDNPDPETKDVQCGVVVYSDFGMTEDQYLGETVLDALRKALKSTVEALRGGQAAKGEVE